MRRSELADLVKKSYDQVGRFGRDAARIYHAVVALDEQVLALRKRLDEAQERCLKCGKFEEMRHPCTCC